MQANADLFEIAKLVRADEELTYTVLVVPSPFLFRALYEHEKGAEVLSAIKRLPRRVWSPGLQHGLH